MEASSECRLIIVIHFSYSPPYPPLGGGLVRCNLKFWVKSGNLSASLLEGGGPRSGGRRAMKSTIFIDLSTLSYMFIILAILRACA